MPCRCCNCGFLTVQERDTGEYLEVNDEFRQTGSSNRYRFPLVPSGSLMGHLRVLCFVDAVDLSAEINAARALGTAVASPVKSVIQEPRECSKFVLHQRGLSPKEHREMSILEKVRAENAEAQQQAAQIADRQHDENLEESRRSRVAAERASRAAIVSAAAAVVTIILAIVIAALSHR
jgi:hypothetical protein